MGDCAPPWRPSSHLCVSLYAEGFAGSCGPSAAPCAAGKFMAFAGIVFTSANMSGATLNHKTAGAPCGTLHKIGTLPPEGEFAHVARMMQASSWLILGKV